MTSEILSLKFFTCRVLPVDRKIDFLGVKFPLLLTKRLVIELVVKSKTMYLVTHRKSTYIFIIRELTRLLKNLYPKVTIFVSISVIHLLDCLKSL